jgi:hypothetical protein
MPLGVSRASAMNASTLWHPKARQSIEWIFGFNGSTKAFVSRCSMVAQGHHPLAGPPSRVAVEHPRESRAQAAVVDTYRSVAG